MSGDRYDDERYVKWARAVKVAADFKCQLCGQKGSYLESHHLDSWDWAIEKRYDIKNGISICKTHHDDFHTKFGHGNNRKYQFDQYAEVYEILKKIAKKQEGIVDTDDNSAYTDVDTHE